MSHLFEPLTLRSITLPNRIAVSPMCQYSCTEGFANDWHLVHLGSRATGGAGLILTEAAAVTPQGRISPADLGIWSDSHVEFLGRITHFIAQRGSVAGIQLAHAGRKASTPPPWENRAVTLNEAEGGWPIVAPSAIPFDVGCIVPTALGENDIKEITTAFVQAARRSLQAGFRVAEIHAAHGYLLHQFLSPLSNQRTDRYGGSFENRTRLLKEIVSAVREVWPDELPLLVRISATDWVEGGWDLEQSIELVRQLLPLGVDLVDCSSGGTAPHARIPLGPGYQTAFAEQIRRKSGSKTGAVGLITAPAQADHIIRSGQADLVLLARELLRDPYWPLRAAKELGHVMPWPAQYVRAAAANTPAYLPR
ncbi:MAG: NADH:flavin oxidoreductase/NADH oxidase [Oryzomonas sp.]|uniref:NADH:flavin oxidoreductase/NADH oxidase n=1 Tax=Oryzomonas sp. TaxID=2855186 RepID=UPI002843A321|nr:NADH:flavin oxidoreductase/NADH oxidase [Oryzomonas sp.]MDR3580138.1 NADH:flavin oxidoreductase/NADH oxidase [Oryzomonas sp.]